jgi:chromosome segregation ATPase
MSDQLRLFRLTQGEVEIKTKQLVDCFTELGALSTQIKEAQRKLRECAEATEIKELKGDLKSTNATIARLLGELEIERIPEVVKAGGASA